MEAIREAMREAIREAIREVMREAIREALSQILNPSATGGVHEETGARTMKSARTTGPTTAALLSSGIAAPTSTTIDSAHRVTSATMVRKTPSCSAVGARPTSAYLPDEAIGEALRGLTRPSEAT